MSPIRALSMDLDDTLWEIRPVITRAEQENYAHVIKRYPRVGQRFTLDHLRELRASIGEAHPEFAHDFTELRRQTLRLVLEMCNYGNDGVEDLLEHFLDLRHQLEPFPDVIDSLRQLSKAYPIVSVSNGNADVGRLDLGRYFTAQINARLVGVGKPDPRIFQAACEAVDANPETVLHIGDHPLEDIAGAQNFGMPTAWMNRYQAKWESPPDPDITVNSLGELADILCANLKPTENHHY